MYGGSECYPITQDAVGLAVNTDICSDFGYVCIM
jgi:hypothetical protein